MKRIALCIIIIVALMLLSSCGADYTDSYKVVSDFCSDYRISGRVYSSLSGEGEEGYIDPSMIHLMFSRTELLPDDYALLMHTRLDTVFEIGVFVTRSGDERMELSEMCLDRIALLSSLSRGSGEVMIKDNLLIYFFTEDFIGVKESINKIL